MKRQLSRRSLLFALKVVFLLIFTFHAVSLITIYLSGRKSHMPERRLKGWNQQKDDDAQLALLENPNPVGVDTEVIMTEDAEEASETQGTTPISGALKVRLERGSSPLKIMMWTTPRILKMRQKRLEKIRDDMNGRDCFEGCRMSVGRNQTEADEADALLLFMFNVGYRRNDLPTRKSWDQIWIYRQHEPPTYFSPPDGLNDLFNWTMTYRRDSDIYHPYSRKLPLGPLESTSELLYIGEHVSLPAWINGKTHLATAVVSKCRTASRREKILMKLRDTGIPIDFFGGCANKTICKRYGENCTDFWGDLSAKYKFFFAFENSLCSDYITEKFWRSLHLGIVPIVYGRGNYADVAPPNSYIDIRNFSSPEELKHYLQKLDRDPLEYSKYFEWRKHFSIKYEIANFCDVCIKLKEHRRREIMEAAGGGSYQPDAYHPSVEFIKVYANLTGWWATEPGHPDRPSCVRPVEMGLGKFFKSPEPEPMETTNYT